MKTCYTSITGYIVYSLFGNNKGMPVSPSVIIFPQYIMGNGVSVRVVCWASQRYHYNKCQNTQPKACSVVLQYTSSHLSLAMLATEVTINNSQSQLSTPQKQKQVSVFASPFLPVSVLRRRRGSSKVWWKQWGGVLERKAHCWAGEGLTGGSGCCFRGRTALPGHLLLPCYSSCFSPSSKPDFSVVGYG